MKRSSGQRAIPKGWRLVRLGDVAQFQQGGTPSKARAEYWDGDIPFVTGADLREVHIGRDNARSFLTKDGLHSGATAVCEEGDLLVATRTRVGLVAIANELMGASQDITLVTPTKSADPSYLCRALVNNAGLLQQRSRGTTIQGVSREDIDSLPILLPPLPEQLAVAAVLDSIDDAIEGAEAVIAATEQLRDSLLHQLLTRGVPGWHTEWKDIPGLGTIPADWEVVRLGEVAEIAFSSVDKKSEQNELPVRLCNYTDVFYNRRIRPEMDFMKATASLVECERWNLKQGDVLFTKDSETPSEIGIPAYVTQSMQDVLCGYHLGMARPHAQLLDGAYLSEAFGSPKLAVQFARIANGVTRFGLTLGATNQLPIPLPSITEQRAISALLEGIDLTLERARTEQDRLQLLKESTADALLTGRVRVLEEELFGRPRQT